MARKRYKPEEIVGLLRQAEVLRGQGMSMADAIRQLGISEVTYYRWRKEYGGMSGARQQQVLDGNRHSHTAEAVRINPRALLNAAPHWQSSRTRLRRETFAIPDVTADSPVVPLHRCEDSNPNLATISASQP